MTVIVIDGKKIKNVKDFHNLIAKLPDIPNYYGKNLDALYDVLVSYSRPFKIVWKESDISKVVLGKEFNAIIEVFDDIKENHKQNELDGFHFILE